ncbi:MAG: hypothetical protein DCF15_11175, partial [Phormidesmis priestleyi]
KVWHVLLQSPRIGDGGASAMLFIFSLIRLTYLVQFVFKAVPGRSLFSSRFTHTYSTTTNLLIFIAC